MALDQDVGNEIKNLSLNRELLNEFAWENIAAAYVEIYQDLI